MSDVQRSPSENVPLVSVWLPTHNRADMLSHAVDSVLAQTHPRLQLIVVDDGSTDATRDVLNELALKWQAPGRQLLVKRNSSPRGAPAARNQAIAVADGMYITGLDDDDAFLPGRIEQFVRVFSERYSGICDCVVEVGDDYQLHGLQPRQEIDRHRIRLKNFVGNQIFTLTTRLRELGGFDERMPAWQDYELWLRLIDRFGPALKLPDCTYRLDRTQDIARITTSSKARAGYEAFISKHGNSMTGQQRRHQQVNDLYNRSVKIGWQEFGDLCDRETALRLIAVFLKVRFPRLYRVLVRSLMRASRWRRPTSYKSISQP